MTSLYSCEKLSLSLECYDSGLSLRHSILSDESFISLWEAQWRAIDLSFELLTPL